VRHYLWRTVDQAGVVLDILIQPRRGAKAAKRFFRRRLKGLRYVPRVIATDKAKLQGRTTPPGRKIEKSAKRRHSIWFTHRNAPQLGEKNERHSMLK
jgi:putative transposase